MYPAAREDLEARLLAAIPTAAIPTAKLSKNSQSVRSFHRRRSAWVGVAMAAAAVCLLVVLLRPESGDRNTAPRLATNPETRESDLQVVPHRPGNSLKITPWLESRRGLDGSERPTFTWPIQEKFPLMVSTSIPADLLD